MPEIDKETIPKELIMEALDKWLDKKLNEFNRWAVSRLMVLALVGVVYLALIGLGWKK